MIKIGRREFILAGSLAAMTLRPSTAKPTLLKVEGLAVDYVVRPLGLESERPVLSWRLQSAERGVRQSAYQVFVASSPSLLKAGQADLWDSGKIPASRSFGITYAGVALRSRQRCWWRVKVWTQHGTASDYSEPSWWEMGLLSSRDWVAQWLVVEDAVAKADRDTPAYWLWHATSGKGVSRTFRYRFQLPAATDGGVLLTATQSAHVAGLWIDGHALDVRRGASDLEGETIALGPLSAGDHWLIAEVKQMTTAPFPVPFLGYTTPPPQFACFARFDRRNGPSFRIVSGPDWEDVCASLMDKNKPWPFSPAINLRREFAINRPLSRARLYATALGAYEAFLNGRRVGDALLTPEVSDYAKRALYRVFDVTDLVKAGANVWGFTVGDGWYASHPGRYSWGPPPRRVIAQLELIYADGSTEAISTDEHWRVARSAIIQSELCVGEVHDARLAQTGWDAAGFDASHWQPATLAAIPLCGLVAQVTPPIRATQVLKPQSITNPFPGAYVFDMGQNFAGWCRLHVVGPVGTRVDLRFGEELAPSGEIDQFVMMGSKAIDTFILRGDPAGETFEPKFAYHGFRYVQVTGLPSVPTTQTLEGIVIHSDLPMTGQLNIDNSLIQQLWRNTLWSQRSNFMGFPTDCPNRAERDGLMGDAGAFWDAAAFNMDVAAFTQRQMDNVRDAQYSDGAFALDGPKPESVDPIDNDGPEPAWADGSVIVTWTSWQRYGDVTVIERNWAEMNRYVQLILDHNPDYVWRKLRGIGFGDWMAPDVAPGQHPFYNPEAQPSTPNDVIGTAYWAHSTELLAQMAEGTGRTADAARLREIRSKVRQAFITAFVKPDGTVGNGSQTSQILALKFDLVPDTMKRAVVARLVADIRRRGIALSTGFIGAQFSLDVLADGGYADIVYSLLLRTDDPSWGYMIAHGATTMWERWDGNLKHLHNEGSHNHPMFGAICGFLFRRIAGIDAAAPGYEKILIRPVLDPRVKRGGGLYDSVVGRISTDWEQTEGGEFTLSVNIPANTTARVHLPAHRTMPVEESGRAIVRRMDIRVIERLDHEVVVEVGSGVYRFAVASH